MTQSDCLILSVPFETKLKTVQYVGAHFANYLQASGQYGGNEVVETDPSSDEESTEIIFEDDIEFLRSLDPKDWKNQDHYAVLGLKSLRYKATDEDIRRAYRQKVLKHHPDKRKAQGEEVRQDDDYFTCITKAYEILGVPNKRRSFDSIDPTFDDSLPSQSEIKKDFYKTFDKYFTTNARWSEKKNVPKIGNANTPREEVEKFYTFWYQFDSWREFSYLDEEEKEKGQDREERRWIEKQNKAARLKRKKEETTRIRSLVDQAYNADPRIAKFKQEEKDKKFAFKKAKQDAAIARKAEEERLLKEAQLAKEKADAEEKARTDALKQEREAQKRALKKERKFFRDYCKSQNYFSEDPKLKLENMTSMEKICEILKLVELEQLNKDIQKQGGELFSKTIKQIEEQIEKERRDVNPTIQNNSISSNSNGVMKSVKKNEWSLEHIELLIKAVNLFPAGTNQRWEVVANFINQHGDSHYTSKEVLAKAKDMQKTDFSKNNLKQNVNQQAFNNFEKSKKNRDVGNKLDTALDNEVKVNGNGLSNGEVASKIVTNGQMTNGDSGEATKAAVLPPTPWTPEEQVLLEQALKTYAKAGQDKWDLIAECIPTRSKKECMRRYKELVDLVKAKKAAQLAATKQ